MRWYAAYTQPRMELWARANLWERGFEVYLPRYQRERRHAGKVDQVACPLFPRYLFVRVDAETQSLRAIASARGVVDLVRMGIRPATVGNDIIDAIRQREQDDGFVHLAGVTFEPGACVQVVSGPMAHLVGVFASRTDDERVVILLNLLGHEVKVRVKAGELAPASDV
jgi:transcriptional antiterminator RfaH